MRNLVSSASNFLAATVLGHCRALIFPILVVSRFSVTRLSALLATSLLLLEFEAAVLCRQSVKAPLYFGCGSSVSSLRAILLQKNLSSCAKLISRPHDQLFPSIETRAFHKPHSVTPVLPSRGTGYNQEPRVGVRLLSHTGCSGPRKLMHNWLPE